MLIIKNQTGNKTGNTVSLQSIENLRHDLAKTGASTDKGPRGQFYRMISNMITQHPDVPSDIKAQYRGYHTVQTQSDNLQKRVTSNEINTSHSDESILQRAQADAQQFVHTLSQQADQLHKGSAKELQNGFLIASAPLVAGAYAASHSFIGYIVGNMGLSGLRSLIENYAAINAEKLNYARLYCKYIRKKY